RLAQTRRGRTAPSGVGTDPEIGRATDVNGRACWRPLAGAGGVRGVAVRIGVLPETVWQGRYHREQRAGGGDRDTAARPRRLDASAIGSRDRDGAFNPRRQPV